MVSVWQTVQGPPPSPEPEPPAGMAVTPRLPLAATKIPFRVPTSKVWQVRQASWTFVSAMLVGTPVLEPAVAMWQEVQGDMPAIAVL